METKKSLTSTHHQILPLHLLLFPFPPSHPKPSHCLTSQVCFPGALSRTLVLCLSAHLFTVPPASSPFAPLIKLVGIQTSHRCLPSVPLLRAQIFTPFQEFFCASLSAPNPPVRCHLPLFQGVCLILYPHALLISSNSHP